MSDTKLIRIEIRISLASVICFFVFFVAFYYYSPSFSGFIDGNKTYMYYDITTTTTTTTNTTTAMIR